MKKFFSLMVIAALSITTIGCSKAPEAKDKDKAATPTTPATPEPAKDATPPAK